MGIFNHKHYQVQISSWVDLCPKEYKTTHLFYILHAELQNHCNPAGDWGEIRREKVKQEWHSVARVANLDGGRCDQQSIRQNILGSVS